MVSFKLFPEHKHATVSKYVAEYWKAELSEIHIRKLDSNNIIYKNRLVKQKSR